jgi:hypothetical protein
MTEPSKMPARIWARKNGGFPGGFEFGEWETNNLSYPTSTVFIRADIAEQREQALVEALRFYADPKNWTGGTILDMEASHFDGWSKAQAALSAWEASNA